MNAKADPTYADVLGAATRIRPHVHVTPVMTCEAINALTGADLFFKCENLQKVGAFKARGATNAVFALTDKQAARGVATHSSGNHAAALALAARLRGVPAYIVMPSNAPAVKRAAVEGYGAEIFTCEPTLAARESKLEEVLAKTSASFIHPYDNPFVIAGQGTAALELLDTVPSLDAIMVPVGGGGLLSGTALATTTMHPTTDVWGAEPSGADDAYLSLRDGTLHPQVAPQTIADGLRTSLSERTFRIISSQVTGILTVTEDNIIRAMRLVWERMKLVVEPSGAVPLGVVLQHGAQFRGKRVGLILSGGNVDLQRLPWPQDE